MAYEQIIYEPGKVARIFLNRPGYLNAQSWLLREELDDAFEQAVQDDQVGAIVLSGKGKSFSAGHDLGTPEDKEYRQKIGKVGKDRFERFYNLREICVENTLRWRNLPKPAIAMVHGYCIFAGWMIASAMDVIFAAESALFQPSHFQYYSVPWDLGPRKTKEVLFEHRFMTAWEVYEYGFINRVYPEDELEKETLAFAGRVAENYLLDPMRVRMVKFSTNHMMDAMGFSAEIETAFNNYGVMMGLEAKDLPRPKDGGLARTNVAKENLEFTRPWLERIKRSGVEDK